MTPQPSDPLRGETAEKFECPLAKLVVFTEHKDSIRRGGISSLIKCVTPFPCISLYLPAIETALSIRRPTKPSLRQNPTL